MSLGVDHFSASAKTGKNVNDVFKRLTERIVASQPIKKKQTMSTRMALGVRHLEKEEKERTGSVFG